MIQLSNDYRVRPLDHLQWVLERRAKLGGGRWKDQESGLKQRGGEWKAYAYCHTRAGLETALSRLRCDEGVFLDPALIADLPDFFPEPK